MENQLEVDFLWQLNLSQYNFSANIPYIHCSEHPGKQAGRTKVNRTNQTNPTIPGHTTQIKQQNLLFEMFCSSKSCLWSIFSLFQFLMNQFGTKFSSALYSLCSLLALLLCDLEVFIFRKFLLTFSEIFGFYYADALNF